MNSDREFYLAINFPTDVELNFVGLFDDRRGLLYILEFHHYVVKSFLYDRGLGFD